MVVDAAQSVCSLLIQDLSVTLLTQWTSIAERDRTGKNGARRVRLYVLSITR